MPRVSKIQSSRTKRARHASEISRCKQLSSLKSIYNAILEIINEINNQNFAPKCFRRIICRAAQYQKFKELPLSYYQYKETVLSKSAYVNPWSPQSRVKTNVWLLSDE